MEYKVIRSKRKSICITFDNDLNVIVKAPQKISDNNVENFVKSKERLILKRLESLKIENVEFFEVKNKTKCMLFGKIETMPKNFKKYYKELACKYLKERINFLSEETNLKYNLLNFKEYKSRWGCCDSNKNIVLNYKLIMVDSKLIDYVILHELCHTKVMNHSKSFYNLLGKFIDYKPLKSKLKRFVFLTKLTYK